MGPTPLTHVIGGVRAPDFGQARDDLLTLSSGFFGDATWTFPAKTLPGFSPGVRREGYVHHVSDSRAESEAQKFVVGLAASCNSAVCIHVVAREPVNKHPWELHC